MKNIIGAIAAFLVLIALFVLGYFHFAYGEKEDGGENLPTGEVGSGEVGSDEGFSANDGGTGDEGQVGAADKGGEKAGSEEKENVDGRIRMLARIIAMNDKIEVEVIESEYAFGVYWVITGEETEIYSASGERITRGGLCAGDVVEIYYNGQVMMSYPPQIVARKITVTKE